MKQSMGSASRNQPSRNSARAGSRSSGGGGGSGGAPMERACLHATQNIMPQSSHDDQVVEFNVSRFLHFVLFVKIDFQ